MHLNFISVFSILICFFNFCHNQTPMSRCLFARATGGYSIPSSGGTCGFGPVRDEISIFTSGALTAPDDETYNGFPFLGPPVSITTGGVGLACGECFEVTGPSGTLILMNADVCDKGCCSNCQGSLGSPPDVQAFDINNAVWDSLQKFSSSGHFAVSYRKVACPVGSSQVSFYINENTEGDPQRGYFRIRFYNHKVGITSAEVMSPQGAGSAAPNQWVSLRRGWTGYFEWSNQGDVRPPFYVRVTSIFNETIQFPTPVNLTQGSNRYFTPGARYYSGQQFSDPPTGWGGATSSSCQWPGPDPNIFIDSFGGAANVAWRPWTTMNVVTTSECLSGSCLYVGPMNPWDMIQISSSTNCAPFPVNYYTNLTLSIKTDGSGDGDLNVFWSQPTLPPSSTSCSSQTQSNSVQLSSVLPAGKVTSTWQTVSIPLSAFATSGYFITLKLQNGPSASPGFYLDNIKLTGVTSNLLTYLDNGTAFYNWWWNGISYPLPPSTPASNPPSSSSSTSTSSPRAPSSTSPSTSSAPSLSPSSTSPSFSSTSSSSSPSSFSSSSSSQPTPVSSSFRTSVAVVFGMISPLLNFMTSLIPFLILF